MSVSPTALRALRWHDRHRLRADALIAALILLADIPIALMPQRAGLGLALPSWPALTAASWCAAGAIITVHRRWPVPCWAALTALPVAYTFAAEATSDQVEGYSYYVLAPLSTVLLIGIPVTLVTVATRLRVVWACVTALVSTASVVAVQYVLDGGDLALLSDYLMPYLLLNVIGALVGIIIRIQSAQVAQLRERSVRTALAREQEMRLAAANERSRIAREMHDIVAHSLAVMITMADGAAAAVDRNPRMAKEALEVLAETGRSALADTRRLVGVLRDDPGASSAPHQADEAAAVPAPTGPRPEPAAGTGAVPVVRDLSVPEFAAPGTVARTEPPAPIADLRSRTTREEDGSNGDLPMAPAPETADLEVLVSRFQAAGVPVDYSWDGAPLPDDKGLQLTLFRIAQESLTNVLRYAPTTQHVEVSVSRFTGTVTLVVVNDAAPGTTPVHGSGKGLIGMRERAAVYGGSVDAGPTPTGWKVQAVLRWDEDDSPATPWQLPH